MSFWDLTDGETAKDTGSEYEMPSGNIEPIPNDSDVLAVVESVKWEKTQNGDEYINAMWSILQPQDFANRKIFQKIWVTDLDPNAKSEDAAKKKRDKARRMLASMDANAGGALTSTNDAPTDDSLAAALCNKPMTIKVMIWEMDDRQSPGDKIRGNWIAAVKPSSAGVSIGKAAPPKQSSGGGGRPSQQIDDEIPFAPEWRI